VDPRRMGKGHGDLLARWIMFCTRVQARAPFYWFIFWANEEKKSFERPWLGGSGDPRIARIRRELHAMDGVESLDSLDLISLRHLAEWLMHLRREGLVDKDDQDRVKELVDERLVDDAHLPLRHFVKCIGEALEKADA